MIIREKNLDYFSDEMDIMTASCQEVVEQQIIPELSLIYTIKITQYEEFIKYTSLIESVIKSAALIQQLREIKNYLHIDNPSNEFIQAIHYLKQEEAFEKKYNAIFDLYYHDQFHINKYLTTSQSLFSHHACVADLEYIVKLANKGIMYTTKIARCRLPATYYCYTKKFNHELLVFLQNIIDDIYDQYNKKLYSQYSAFPLSQEAFSSVITTLAFRLQLAVKFIECFYITQEMIEEKHSLDMDPPVEEYFLRFLGEMRSKALEIS